MQQTAVGQCCEQLFLTTHSTMCQHVLMFCAPRWFLFLWEAGWWQGGDWFTPTISVFLLCILLPRACTQLHVGLVATNCYTLVNSPYLLSSNPLASLLQFIPPSLPSSLFPSSVLLFSPVTFLFLKELKVIDRAVGTKVGMHTDVSGNIIAIFKCLTQ